MPNLTPLLLQPKLDAIRRRLLTPVTWKSESARELVLVLFVAIVILAIHQGTLWALAKVNENPNLTFLRPGQFLAMVFMLLFLMLMISSAFAAIGTLFLSDDLELVLAAPVSTCQFVTGKFFSVLLASAWMPAVFLTPLLIAFAKAFHAPWWFIPGAIVTMLPYFVIPAAAGICVAVLMVMVVPVYRVRQMAVLIMVGFLVGIYFIVDILRLEWTSSQGAEEILRMISFLSMPSLSWLPPTWIADVLDEWLRPRGLQWMMVLEQLYLCAALCLSVAYLCIKFFHESALARSRNKRQGDKWESRFLERTLRVFGNRLDPQLRAMIGKELRLVSRDMSQAAQVLLLLVLGLIYLYHLRLFSAVESFPDSAKLWWKSFLFLGNVCMGAFITTAICTRLVFPSISLEGRSFWVIQTSPILLPRLLRIKFWCWFVPVSAVAAVFFAFGAFAIGADVRMIIISAVSSFIMCWGIVGVAIGLGGVFALFDWESPSQLAAGFGSFVFMLCSIILIFMNMVPGFILLLHGSSRYGLTIAQVYLTILGTLLLLIVLNVQAARLALKAGEKSLANAETASGT